MRNRTGTHAKNGKSESVGYTEALKATVKRVNSMSRPQLVKSLRDAGILTRSGKMAKVYRMPQLTGR